MQFEAILLDVEIKIKTLREDWGVFRIEGGELLSENKNLRFCPTCKLMCV